MATAPGRMRWTRCCACAIAPRPSTTRTTTRCARLASRRPTPPRRRPRRPRTPGTDVELRRRRTGPHADLEREVGPRSAGSLLCLDRRVDVAAVEERQAPGEGRRVARRACEIVKGKEARIGRGRLIGIDDAEISYAGNRVDSLQGRAEILRRCRTIETGRGAGTERVETLADEEQG